MPPDRHEVRPLGPHRASIAHRAAAAALALSGLFAATLSPLLAFVLLCAAAGVVMDGRGLFGVGRHRAMLAFVAAPWLGLAGIAMAILGSIPEPDSFLLAPGLALLLLAVALLAWSFLSLRRSQAGRAP